MSLKDDEILDVLNVYIKNKKMNYAILLDGDWGSGKTFFIKNHFIKDRKNIIYISLYGIQNIEGVTKKIYNKILENNIPTKIKESKKYKIAKDTTGTILKISDKLIKKVFHIDISELSNLKSTDIIGWFKNISDYVIVFDDLERCEIPVNEILGYINEYVEHRDVKCIIIANEKEIDKINYDSNYELKVLSCLDDSIDYEDKQQDSIFNNQKKEDKKTDISTIKNRILNMYDGNKKYKAIKEKLIGVTIKYVPEINKIYDSLISEYKNKENKLYNFLKQNKNECIDILQNNDCNNIRTLNFIIDRFESLYNEISSLDIQQKENILHQVFKNTVFSSIGMKKGIDISQILAGVICSDSVTLTHDSKQNHNNYYTAFNFVDDFIINGSIDKEQMIESINYYLSIHYEKIEENDPYNKLCSYWELEDDEIKEALNDILINIKKNKYSYKLFPKIIYSISCIENLNFEEEKIKSIIEEIGKYFEKNHVEYIDFHVFARDKQVADIYNKNIKYVQEKIEICNLNNNKNSLKEILNNVDWGIQLNEYVREHSYLDKKQFLNDFDIDVVVENIKKSNSKNIYHFKYCIDKVYNFSNLKDFYLNDLDKLKELIKKLEDLDKAEFGITKKEAIQYLIVILKEKRDILEQ